MPILCLYRCTVFYKDYPKLPIDSRRHFLKGKDCILCDLSLFLVLFTAYLLYIMHFLTYFHKACFYREVDQVEKQQRSTVWRHYLSFTCKFYAVSRSFFSSVCFTCDPHPLSCSLLRGYSNSEIGSLFEIRSLIGVFLNFSEIFVIFSCFMGSALQVTICSDSSERSYWIIFIYDMIFLCLLVLNEGGLCFSNNGICEEYY